LSASIDKVMNAADSRGAVVYFARTRFHIVDELTQRRDRQVGMRSQEHRRAAKQRERNYVLRIIAELLEQRGIGREDAAICNEKSIAVSRSAHQRVHGENRAATGAVFDDYGLTDPLLQMLADDTRHGVRQAARCIGHDEADPLIGIRGLSVRG
jgi:hypothetical protein